MIRIEEKQRIHSGVEGILCFFRLKKAYFDFLTYK